jgi:hypothetical protein
MAKTSVLVGAADGKLVIERVLSRWAARLTDFLRSYPRKWCVIPIPAAKSESLNQVLSGLPRQAMVFLFGHGRPSDGAMMDGSGRVLTSPAVIRLLGSKRTYGVYCHSAILGERARGLWSGAPYCFLGFRNELFMFLDKDADDSLPCFEDAMRACADAVLSGQSAVDAAATYRERSLSHSLSWLCQMLLTGSGRRSKENSIAKVRSFMSCVAHMANVDSIRHYERI